MLLNDIDTSPNTTFRKINQHLRTNYGFKISESTSDKDLVSIMEQIQDEVTELKIKGDDSRNSPEISKRLLVLEGIRSLRVMVMEKFQSRKFDNVVSNLVDFIVDTFDLTATEGDAHDCYERAVHKAMEEYRSSRYRFPDDIIEHRIRQEAMDKINNEGRVSPDEFSDEDEYMEEGSRNGTEHGANEWLASTSEVNRPTKGPQIPMIRDKHGRMVPDPIAQQAAERRAGRVSPT